MIWSRAFFRQVIDADGLHDMPLLVRGHVSVVDEDCSVSVAISHTKC